MQFEDHTSLDLDPREALTIYRSNKDVVIVVNYLGDIESLLTMMHEIGHALHYIALETAGIDVDSTPTIPRETAAFIAERILVEYMKAERLCAEHIEDFLYSQRHKYFDSGCADLIDCLLGTKAFCSYNCAYPIAWNAAENAQEQLLSNNHFQLSELFTDPLKWKFVLPLDSNAEYSFATFDESELINSYPFSYFRALGACLVIDLALGNDIVNQSIAHYFSALVDARMSGSGLKIVLDEHKKPTGYIISDNQSEPVRHRRVCSITGSIVAIEKASRVKEYPPSNLTPDSTQFSDTYFKLGSILRLLSSSAMHRERVCKEYFLNEIMPAVELEQFKLLYDDSHNPVGFLSWAITNDEALDALVNGRAHLNPNEWNSGDQLLYNDFIAPWGHAKQLMKFGRDTHLSMYGSARGLRRLPDGTIKRSAVYR